MDDVYENIDDYNPSRKRKILIVFDDMVAGIMTSKKFQTVIKQLFIRCRKKKYFTCFYHTVSLYCSKRREIMKINNKRELQNITIKHSAEIDYTDFMKNYRECTENCFNFLALDTTSPASNPLIFRKNLLDDSL